MNIKSLFSKKEKVVEAEFTPVTYNIGYEVHTKDGAIGIRYYENVSEEKREDIRKMVNKEIELLESILNLSVLEKKEFVNLSGTVIRLSDFSKISVFDKIQNKGKEI
jgi:hypothetical protein